MKINNLPPCSEFASHWSLDPAVVFLNHGSFGACPRRVIEFQQRLRGQMESNPARFLVRDLEVLLDESREKLASLIKTSADNLAFNHNATTGVNAVVSSLDLRPGDEILTTSHDYGPCRSALKAAAQRARARVVVAPVPFPIRREEEIIDAILAAATDRTRLAMIDHVTSPTALIFPITKIVRALEERGIDTLVDGAHAPGTLPLDLDALHPAYYTSTCHKWLCAPKGAGFLYVRPDRHEQIVRTMVSVGYNTPRPGRSPLHNLFDWIGTFDPTAWICVGEAIRWCDSLFADGMTELMNRNHALAVQARGILCQALHVEPPCPESMLGSMAALSLPQRFQILPLAADGSDSLLNRLYDEFGIEVAIKRWGETQQRCVRISAQAYNSPDQYVYLGEALKSIAA